MDVARWADPAWLGIGHDRVCRIVSAAVETFLCRHPQFCESFPDTTEQDLVQECLLAIARYAEPRQKLDTHGRPVRGKTKGFTPRKDLVDGGASTWATIISQNCLKMKMRMLSRRKRKEDAFRRDNRTISVDEGVCVLEWLEGVYSRTQRYLKALNRPDADQSARNVAVLALKNKMGYTPREMAAFLEDRPALCRIVHLDKPPTVAWLSTLHLKMLKFSFAVT